MSSMLINMLLYFHFTLKYEDVYLQFRSLQLGLHSTEFETSLRFSTWLKIRPKFNFLLLCNCISRVIGRRYIFAQRINIIRFITIFDIFISLRKCKTPSSLEYFFLKKYHRVFFTVVSISSIGVSSPFLTINILLRLFDSRASTYSTIPCTLRYCKKENISFFISRNQLENTKSAILRQYQILRSKNYEIIPHSFN